jgi:hypothetical protein
MVDKEKPDLSTCVWQRTTCEPVEIRRNPSGDWTVAIEVDLKVALPDGRTVTFAGELSIKGRQSGHRPRANAFGRDKKVL